MAERLFYSHTGLTPKYLSYTHYPWAELERQTGMKFNENQRQDIFDVWEQFEFFRHEAEEMPTIASLEKIRAELIDLCSRMHRATGVVDGDEEKENGFDALCWYMGDGVRDAVEAARTAAFEALCELGRAPRDGAVIEDVRGGKAVTLRHVLALIRRPISDGGMMRGQTWGLQPGRSSPPFHRFLRVLLERQDLKAQDVKNAIDALERNLDNRNP